jgi:flagellar basal-body rod protein FlgF
VENALLIGLSRQVPWRASWTSSPTTWRMSAPTDSRRSARFNEFLMPVAKADAFKPADRPLSYVIDKGTPLDLSQGTIEMTGNPLDVALKGDNYLVVQTPNGERYTRAGS